MIPSVHMSSVTSSPVTVTEIAVGGKADAHSTFLAFQVELSHGGHKRVLLKVNLAQNDWLSYI
jgi:hypothetical protein